MFSLQPVKHSRCCKTKLHEYGDCEKDGVGCQEGWTLGSCSPPSKWDTAEEQKGGEEGEEGGREEWR